MNRKDLFRAMVVFGVLAVTLVFSGASCSRQPTSQSSSNTETDEEAVELPRQERSMLQKRQENAGTAAASSVESDVLSFVSSEISIANQDQSDISSNDAEDRALVMSDAEAFGGVGALGSEYSYE